jgi:hypothetical protein
MLASTIIRRVGDIAQDATNVRWPEEELLRWLTDAQREVVLYRPEANVRHEGITLTAQRSKQTLPEGGMALLDVIRNLGADGSTFGRAIRVVAREILDSQLPEWHAAPPAAEIKHFVFDKRDPKTFYVWPRPNGPVQVEAMFQAAPAEVTSMDDTLDLPDVYANALVDYVLYRAYSKDAEYAGNAQRAVAHYQAFKDALGLMTAVETAYAPTTNSVLNPNYPGQRAPAA